MCGVISINIKPIFFFTRMSYTRYSRLADYFLSQDRGNSCGTQTKLGTTAGFLKFSASLDLYTVPILRIVKFWHSTILL